MKKAVAYILLTLCVGYAGGILLETYNHEHNTSTSVKINTSYHFPVKTAEVSNTSSEDEFSTQEFIAIEALATSIGKLKVPEASSCPVITATFTLSPYQFFYSSTLTDPAQQHSQPASIFLQNCVLRL